MKLSEFIVELQRVKPSLQEKEIVIQAPNGVMFEPSIKFIMKNDYECILDAEHIDKAIISWRD